MSWSRFRRLSLTAQLLSLLLPAMLLVVGAELVATRVDALASADAAYDRSLSGALRSLDANVSTASGGLSIELPYRLFEFFQLTANGAVYFRVATADGVIEIGSPDLPLPPEPLRDNVPVFYDAEYFGESLRLGAYTRPLAQPLSGSPAQRLIIQVAENTVSRQQFSRNFVVRAATRDGLVLLAVMVALALIVAVALRPLARLAQQVRTRSPADMAPLDSDGLPADVVPLVGAINHQLQRTQSVMAQQRIFLDDASHQLRTSLATLRTQIDYALLTKDKLDTDATLHALARQVSHATRSTNQLLALARSDTAALRLGDFDAGELLREVALALLPRARERRIDLGVDVVDSLNLFGDRGMLREALANLADNAIRHAPEEGVVTLHGEVVDGEQRLSVLDNGPGMDPELMARVGERFLRAAPSVGSGAGSSSGSGSGSVSTANVHSGAGLGLAIARSIAERHHGGLTLAEAGDAPAPGPGLVVSIRWPAPQGKEET
jgi:two-component system sensor histidine kinase TctE